MDADRSDRPVVVGVDDSEVSLAAVDWAVGEASGRNGWLRSSTPSFGRSSRTCLSGRPRTDHPMVVCVLPLNESSTIP
jgi:hypothetical protein